MKKNMSAKRGGKNRAPRSKVGNKFPQRVSHTGTRSATRIAPDELDVRLMFRYSSSLNNGAGGLAAKTFYSNCAYDVDPAVGSTETFGFDEYASIYSYYRVIGYSYEVTVVNQSTVPILAYVLNTNTDPTLSGSNFALYSTNAHCQSKLLSQLSPNKHTFRGRHSIAQIAGTTAVETADSYRSLVTNIPSDRTFISVATEAIGAATVSSTYDIKLIMTIRFYSREVDLTLAAQSARIMALVAANEDYKQEKKRRLTRQLSKDRASSSPKTN